MLHDDTTPPLPVPDQQTSPTSRRQVAANRRNAQRGTGPRTPAGKARSAANSSQSTGPRTAHGKKTSSRNALKYGLWATADLLLTGESPDQWAALYTGMREFFAPRGIFEEVLVDRIASVVWRVHRLQRVETSLHAAGEHHSFLSHQTAEIYRRTVCDSLPPDPEHIVAAAAEGKAWLYLAQESHAWAEMQRAEAALERILHRTLALLERCQGPRATWIGLLPPLLPPPNDPPSTLISTPLTPE